MDKAQKAIKKSYNKSRRKATRPFKGLTVFAGVLAVAMTGVSTVAGMFDNTFAIFANQTFWRLENEDPNATYFKMEMTQEQLKEYSADICKQVEAEGAVLLYNENNALPLKKGASVSCFSTSSVNFVYGGTGSGAVDTTKAPDLKQALEKSEFNVNQKLWDFYKTGAGSAYKRVDGGFTGVSAVGEAPWNVYSNDVKDSVSQFGDAAIVVLSRTGGEGSDLPYKETNYLALDQNEKDMLSNVKQMKEAGKIQKIVVLVNTSNALQMDFMKDNPYGVDAILWTGGVGQEGLYAVADILNGTINPSGSLVDTYCYDNYSSPAMKNFEVLQYKGNTEAIPSSAVNYMVYQENIYVGYKYYETRYEDYVLGAENVGDFNYGSTVYAPFGFGLSYGLDDGAFEYSDFAVAETDTAFEVSLTVTNNTGFAGKETVQIYAQSEYTDYDKQTGIEKSAVKLVGFGKTDVLEVGASEDVTVTVNKSDLAVYDSYGEKTYIMEQGQQYLTAATDAHNAVNNILAKKGVTADTNEKVVGKGDASLVYNWTQADTVKLNQSLNGTEITNLFDSADLNLNTQAGGNVVYLSRQNWKGTFPSAENAGTIPALTLNEHLIDGLQTILYDPEDYAADDVAMPKMNAKNGKTMYDMIGKEFDDPDWQLLLDNLSFEDMQTLVVDSFHWTMPIESINKPGTRDENGPQGLTASLFGAKTELEPMAFTSEDVMAATFNKDLMYELGKCIGMDFLSGGFTFMYGPGNNIHRTPYSGRNFEYYSEDGYLSGAICAPEVKGIEEFGVRVMMKHFATNDSETARIGLGVWANEQTLREIYFKACQEPIEVVGGNGVMMSYTRLGTTWCGASKNLLTGLLRKEWGATGMFISDNALDAYVNAVDGVMAGLNTLDSMLADVIQMGQIAEYKNDPVIVNAMREMCHYSLYTIANSNAMNGIGPDTKVVSITPPLNAFLNTTAATLWALFGAGLALTISRSVAFRKNNKKTWKNK